VKAPERLSDIRLASRVAGRAAHDLNNVAAVLSGHIYLLRTSAEPPEEAFEAMEKAMAHFQRLTQSLGVLSGVGTEEEGLFDLNTLAADVAREAEEVGRGPFRLDLDSNLPELLGRRGDVRLAMGALFANAREASGPSGEIRVSTRPLADGLGAALSVEDQGSGIPPEAAERIFDPFFSTKGEKGLGIGLTLAAAVAALHGGSCEVEGRPEGGTRAVLQLRNSKR
jgi:two-component system NtrC family sensor kinase